jgi:ketosteroid isomerase-like protein
MKNSFACTLMVFMLTACTQLLGQTAINSNQTEKRIDAANKQIAGLVENKKTKELLSYYKEDAVCMPEFYVQMFRKEDIKQFYQQFFSVNTIRNYRKHIYEVIVEKNYIIETGTFISDIVKDEKSSFVYRGKYLNIWQQDDQNNLKIVTQIWGASNWIDRATLTNLPSQNKSPWMPAIMKDTLTEEVMAKTRMLRQAVFAGDAKAQTEFYSNDAIYMPYYDSMFIGKQNIDHYFTSHYSPDWFFDSLSINTSKIIKLENLVVECGYYFVQWRNTKNENGTVTGKSVNIWKRNEEGELQMFRQIVNHD